MYAINRKSCNHIVLEEHAEEKKRSGDEFTTQSNMLQLVNLKIFMLKMLKSILNS